MAKHIELPKSHYITFQPYEFKLVNEATIQNYSQTLEEIAFDEPTNACLLLHRILLMNSHIMPKTQVETDVGIISSEQDGDAIAYGAFLSAIRNNIVGSSPINPLQIVLSSLDHVYSAQQARTESIVVPQFTLSVEPPAFA